MKMRITIDVNVSKTLAQTMKRNGFNVIPEGTGLAIRIPNSPAITKSKTQITFNEITEDAQNKKETA
jgi:hypothetical protein